MPSLWFDSSSDDLFGGTTADKKALTTSDRFDLLMQEANVLTPEFVLKLAESEGEFGNMYEDMIKTEYLTSMDALREDLKSRPTEQQMAYWNTLPDPAKQVLSELGYRAPDPFDQLSWWQKPIAQGMKFFNETPVISTIATPPKWLIGKAFDFFGFTQNALFSVPRAQADYLASEDRFMLQLERAKNSLEDQGISLSPEEWEQLKYEYVQKNGVPYMVGYGKAGESKAKKIGETAVRAGAFGYAEIGRQIAGAAANLFNIDVPDFLNPLIDENTVDVTPDNPFKNQKGISVNGDILTKFSDAVDAVNQTGEYDNYLVNSFARVWEGEKYIEPYKQMEQWKKLREAKYPASTFDFAMWLGKGQSVDDWIVQREKIDIESEEFGQRRQVLSTYLQQPIFKEVVTELKAKYNRLSIGRQFAYGLGMDPDTTGWDFVSGSADFAANIFLDPTIVGGKLFALSKVAIKGVQLLDIPRVISAMKVVERAANVADEATVFSDEVAAGVRAAQTSVPINTIPDLADDIYSSQQFLKGAFKSSNPVLSEAGAKITERTGKTVDEFLNLFYRDPETGSLFIDKDYMASLGESAVDDTDEFFKIMDEVSNDLQQALSQGTLRGQQVDIPHDVRVNLFEKTLEAIDEVRDQASRVNWSMFDVRRSKMADRLMMTRVKSYNRWANRIKDAFVELETNPTNKTEIINRLTNDLPGGEGMITRLIDRHNALKAANNGIGLQEFDNVADLMGDLFLEFAAGLGTRVATRGFGSSAVSNKFRLWSGGSVSPFYRPNEIAAEVLGEGLAADIAKPGAFLNLPEITRTGRVVRNFVNKFAPTFYRLDQLKDSNLLTRVVTKVPRVISNSIWDITHHVPSKQVMSVIGDDFVEEARKIFNMGKFVGMTTLERDEYFARFVLGDATDGVVRWRWSGDDSALDRLIELVRNPVKDTENPLRTFGVNDLREDELLGVLARLKDERIAFNTSMSLNDEWTVAFLQFFENMLDNGIDELAANARNNGLPITDELRNGLFDEIEWMQEIKDSLALNITSETVTEVSEAARFYIIEQFLTDLFGRMKITDEYIDGLAAQGKSKWVTQLRKRVYGPNDRDIIKSGGVRNRVPLLPVAQYSSQMAIPDFRDLLTHMQNLKRYQKLYRFALSNSLTDAVIGRYWKPLTLLRLGFIPRAAGEELFAFFAREGFRAITAMSAAAVGRDKRGLLSGTVNWFGKKPATWWGAIGDAGLQDEVWKLSYVLEHTKYSEYLKSLEARVAAATGRTQLGFPDHLQAGAAWLTAAATRTARNIQLEFLPNALKRAIVVHADMERRGLLSRYGNRELNKMILEANNSILRQPYMQNLLAEQVLNVSAGIPEVPGADVVTKKIEVRSGVGTSSKVEQVEVRIGREFEKVDVDKVDDLTLGKVAYWYGQLANDPIVVQFGLEAIRGTVTESELRNVLAVLLKQHGIEVKDLDNVSSLIQDRWVDPVTGTLRQVDQTVIDELDEPYELFSDPYDVAKALPHKLGDNTTPHPDFLSVIEGEIADVTDNIQAGAGKFADEVTSFIEINPNTGTVSLARTFNQSPFEGEEAIIDLRPVSIYNTPEETIEIYKQALQRRIQWDLETQYTGQEEDYMHFADDINRDSTPTQLYNNIDLDSAATQLASEDASIARELLFSSKDQEVWRPGAATNRLYQALQMRQNNLLTEEQFQNFIVRLEREYKDSEAMTIRQRFFADVSLARQQNNPQIVRDALASMKNQNLDADTWDQLSQSIANMSDEELLNLKFEDMQAFYYAAGNDVAMDDEIKFLLSEIKASDKEESETLLRKLIDNDSQKKILADKTVTIPVSEWESNGFKPFFGSELYRVTLRDTQWSVDEAGNLVLVPNFTGRNRGNVTSWSETRDFAFGWAGPMGISGADGRRILIVADAQALRPSIVGQGADPLEIEVAVSPLTNTLVIPNGSYKIIVDDKNLFYSPSGTSSARSLEERVQLPSLTRENLATELRMFTEGTPLPSLPLLSKLNPNKLITGIFPTDDIFTIGDVLRILRRRGYVDRPMKEADLRAAMKIRDTGAILNAVNDLSARVRKSLTPRNRKLLQEWLQGQNSIETPFYDLAERFDALGLDQEVLSAPLRRVLADQRRDMAEDYETIIGRVLDGEFNDRTNLHALLDAALKRIEKYGDRSMLDSLNIMTDFGTNSRYALLVLDSAPTRVATFDEMRDALREAYERGLRDPNMQRWVQSSRRFIVNSRTGHLVGHPVTPGQSEMYTLLIDKDRIQIFKTLREQNKRSNYYDPWGDQGGASQMSPQMKEFMYGFDPLIQSIAMNTPDITERELELLKNFIDGIDSDVLDLGIAKMDSSSGYPLFPLSTTAFLNQVDAERVQELLLNALVTPGMGPRYVALDTQIGRSTGKVGVPLERDAVDAIRFADNRDLVTVSSNQQLYKFDSTWSADPVVNTENDPLKAWAEDLTDVTVDSLTNGSNQILHEILVPIVNGQFSTHVMGQVNRTDLPRVLYAPVEFVPDANIVDRVTRGGFNFINAAVAAIARKPMWLLAYADAYEGARLATASLRTAGLDDWLLRRLAKEPYQVSYEDIRSIWALIPHEISREISSADDLLIALDNGLFRNLFDESHPGYQFFSNNLQDPETIDRTLRWMRMDATVEEQAVKIAARSAISAVTPYIDDAAVRSFFQDKARNIFPFLFAQEAFLKRWIRGFMYDPVSIRRAQLLAHGVTNSMFTYEDPYGNKYFVIPGTEALFDLLGRTPLGVLGLSDVKVPVNVSGVINYERFLPGIPQDFNNLPAFSPLAMIPVDATARMFPEMRPFLENFTGGMPIDTNGDLLRDGLANFFPKNYARMLSGILSEITDNGGVDAVKAEAQAAQIGAVSQMAAEWDRLSAERQQLIAAGRLEEASDVLKRMNEFMPPSGADRDPELLERHLAMVKRWSYRNMFVRGLIGWTVGTTPQNYFEGQELRDEFKALLQHFSFDEAVAIFNAENPYSEAYTIFASKKETRAPLPRTGEAAEWLRTNKGWLDSFGLAAPWLLPPAKTKTDYDASAMADYQAEALFGQKDLLEFYKDYKFAKGANEYFPTKLKYDVRIEQAGSDSERSAIRKEWEAVAESIKAQHPIFADRLMAGITDDAEKTLNEMKLILDLPEDQRPDIQAFDGLKLFTNSYFYYKTQYDELRDNNTKVGRARRDSLRREFIDWGSNALGVYPEMRNYWNAVILPATDLTSAWQLKQELGD